MLHRLTCCWLCVTVLSTTAASLSFESLGNTIDHWDLLDYSGGGDLRITTDLSCPPGYGPDVLCFEGDVAMALARGAALSEGTFIVLYKELAPASQDADGVIMVWARYGEDLSAEHNAKIKRPHVWLEQDNDLGFQFRAIDAEEKEYPIGERVGYGLVTGEWNETNWIWQKVQVAGNQLRAKYWSAQSPEPDEWALETSHGIPAERFGLRINSGAIHVAYFAADPGDIHPPTPPAYLHLPSGRVTNPDEAPFTLYTNADRAAAYDCDVIVSNPDRELSRVRAKLDIAAGHQKHSILLTTNASGKDLANIVLPLRESLPEGRCTIAVKTSGDEFSIKRSFDVMPVSDIRQRFERADRLLTGLQNILAGLEIEPNRKAALQVIHDAARAHLQHSIQLFDAGDVEASDLSYRFVVEALSELHGYKGAWLGDAKEQLDLKFIPERFDDARGIGTPKDKVSDFYSTEYQLSFGDVQSDVQSLVMGCTYEMVIPWRVEGKTPDRDFKFRAGFVSPLGDRIVAKSSAAPSIPTSQWRPGRVYEQRITLAVSAEDAVTRPAEPVVLDEVHRLLISVTDPQTGAFVLLGNTPGDQIDRVGTSFLAGQFYISSAPVEIRQFQPENSPVLEERNDGAVLRNIGDARMDATALITVTAESGRVVFQAARCVTLEPGKESGVSFKWTPKTAGRLRFRVEAVENNITRTEASRTVVISPPKGLSIAINKQNHVLQKNGSFVTPVHIRFDGAKHPPCTASVYANGKLNGKAEAESGDITVEAEPWFGYYDVTADFGAFDYEERIVATVVESDSGRLLVNGEPFVVKGVNVHGLDSRSPQRTATMMRVMRELGFNAWRGDYPARWQMELAYELNSFYTVLAPFSCDTTPEAFGRQAGPPLGTAREVTRLFIERYRDSAGVLLWNSCNEIIGENVDFLLSLYPLYRAFDPYNRPVHYANLYGQDLWQGQDLMGVNYYFGEGQTAEDRQPLIQRSVELGGEHDIPAIFCEYNSYYGAIHTTGVQAMEGIFEWGVDVAGMAGGFLYMRPNSSSHPGVMDDSYNTHRIFDGAIRKAFADATVQLLGVSGGEVKLRITNKRGCTLRSAALACSIAGIPAAPLQFDAIEPRGELDIALPLPQSISGKACAVEGSLEFVTHFGFTNRIPFRLVAQ